MTATSAPQKSPSEASSSIAHLSDWELMPDQLLAAHRFVAGLKIREWRTAQPDLSLQKAVVKYLDSLPADLPADVLFKLTKIGIEVFEKQSAEEPVAA